MSFLVQLMVNFLPSDSRLDLDFFDKKHRIVTKTKISEP